MNCAAEKKEDIGCESARREIAWAVGRLGKLRIAGLMAKLSELNRLCSHNLHRHLWGLYTGNECEACQKFLTEELVRRL